MRNYDKEILILSRGLPRESTSYTFACPNCGMSGSFSVTNNGLGILYNCFRNKCGIRGFIPNADTISDVSAKEPVTKEYKPIETFRLSAAQVRFFVQKFNLYGVREYGFKWAPKYKRVFIPIRDYYGREIGHLLRGYKELGEYEGPKTLNFKYSHTIPFAYYSFDCMRKSRIVLVEDVISCLKVFQVIESGSDVTGVPTDIGVISLMGTSISTEMARLLRPKDVTLWLDGDAITKSFRIKENLSLYLRNVDVVYTKSDPKDLSHEQIRETLLGTKDT